MMILFVLISYIVLLVSVAPIRKQFLLFKYLTEYLNCSFLVPVRNRAGWSKGRQQTESPWAAASALWPQKRQSLWVWVLFHAHGCTGRSWAGTRPPAGTSELLHWAGRVWGTVSGSPGSKALQLARSGPTLLAGEAQRDGSVNRRQWESSVMGCSLCWRQVCGVLVGERFVA